MGQKETYEGYVTDNNDPEQRGRLSVMCQQIVAGETIEWVEPKFPFVDSEGRAGWVFIPNVGSSVTVEVETGREAEVNDLQPKWFCESYPQDTFPEEFKTNYPQRRGFKTKEGHVFFFDDTDGAMTFTYQHPSGTEVIVTNEGQIQLSPASGQSVLIGDGADQPIPLGTLLKTLLANMTSVFNLHQHTDSLLGLTTKPTTTFPTVDDTILSSLHKVQS